MITGQKRRPRAFGYGRASTDKQAASLPRQLEVVTDYFELNKKTGKLPEDCEWGGWFGDDATSGTVPLFDRPQGELLSSQLYPGDHVISWEIERVFRGLRDACEVIDRLMGIDVQLHVIGVPFDLATKEGRCFFQVMVSFAELERAKISERTKAGLEHKKRNGLPYGKRFLPGWKIVGEKRDARWTKDMHARRVGKYIVELHDLHGISFDNIYLRLPREGVRVDGKVIPRDRVRLYYRAHLAGYPADEEIVKRAAYDFGEVRV